MMSEIKIPTKKSVTVKTNHSIRVMDYRVPIEAIRCYLEFCHRGSAGQVKMLTLDDLKLETIPFDKKLGPFFKNIKKIFFAKAYSICLHP